MTKVQELQPGDEILCFMRLGFAIGTARGPHGRVYHYVPPKSRRARPEDLTRFVGLVLRNDPVLEVLHMQVTRVGRLRIARNRENPSGTVDIHYSMFKRIQRYSKYSHEPQNSYEGRPTKYEGLGTNRKPYRTLEDIKLR